MNDQITIVGAGLTGMIAAHIFQQARVVEACTFDKMQPHRALLRFRSNIVSEVTGIPFREVTVRKGIFADGRFIPPDIRAANAYALKCTGKILPRSIWDVAPCQRWVAPDNFIELLQANLQGRIDYGKAYQYAGHQSVVSNLGPERKKPVISTVPMGIVAKQLRTPSLPKFEHKGISVHRIQLHESWDVFQTVYFPFKDTNVYRASITGRTLIVEAKGIVEQQDLDPVLQAFCLNDIVPGDMEINEQKFGKITPIKDSWRRAFIHELSDQLGVYSLGRFGTWRNILLDDVVHDCAVIKRLMMADSYDKGKIRAVK